jgi:hypothetical protein
VAEGNPRLVLRERQSGTRSMNHTQHICVTGISGSRHVCSGGGSHEKQIGSGSGIAATDDMCAGAQQRPWADGNEGLDEERE